MTHGVFANCVGEFPARLRHCGLFAMVAMAFFVGDCQRTSLHADDAAVETEEVIEALPAAKLQPPRQPADDIARQLEPKHPQTPADAQASLARTWFLVGKVRTQQEKYTLAIRAYENAIECQPTDLATYGVLIPLLSAQKQHTEARQYALAAAALSTDGVVMARNYAALLVANNELIEAIGVLNAVVLLPNLDKKSIAYFVAARDLGLFLRMNKQARPSAAWYGIVFDALLSKDSPLSEEDRQLLLSDRMYDEFGETFLKAKMPELALKAFEIGSQQRKVGAEIHSYNLATVFRETGKPEAALEELNKYFRAQLQTRGREAYQMLKELLTELKRPNDLLPTLEQMSSRDPKNMVLTYFLADETLDSGRTEEAEKLYQRGGVKEPQRLIGLAEVALNRKKYDAVFSAIDIIQVLRLELENSGIQARVNVDLADFKNRLKRFEKQIEKDPEAVKQLLAMAKPLREGNDPKLTIAQALFLTNLAFAAGREDEGFELFDFIGSLSAEPDWTITGDIGQRLLDAQKYKLAAKIFQTSLERPSNEQRVTFLSLYFLAGALGADGQTEPALEAARRIYKLPELDVRWLFYAKNREGSVLTQAGQYDAAIKLLGDFVKERKAQKGLVDLLRSTQFSLSNAYVQKGDYPAGEKILEEIIAEAKDNPQANNDLGYLWADQGKNLEQAREMIQLALDSEPDNVAYIDSFGWVLFKMNELAEARTYLLRACKMPGGADAGLWEHLGDCEEKMGLKDEAQKTYEHAWQIETAKGNADEKIRKRLKEKLPESVTKKTAP